MKIQTITFLSILALGFSGCNNYSDALNEAPPLGGDIEAGANVYETYGCAGCHGADATNSALGVSRNITQIGTARDIENSLYALQALTSDRHEAMKGVAADLNSQEIVDVALYVNSLK